jgi:hypothetical protein
MKMWPLELAIDVSPKEHVINFGRPNDYNMKRGACAEDDLVCGRSSCVQVLLPGWTPAIAAHFFRTERRLLGRCPSCGSVNVIPHTIVKRDELNKGELPISGDKDRN